MDPDLDEPKVSIWGMDNSTTQIAVAVFLERYLPRFLEQSASGDQEVWAYGVSGASRVVLGFYLELTEETASIRIFARTSAGTAYSLRTSGVSRLGSTLME